MKNLYRQYSESYTPHYIQLETLDSIIDSLERDGIMILHSQEATRINDQLNHNTKADKGLSSVEGSVTINDNTLAYFGHDYQLKDGDGAKAYDFIIRQNDTADVTTLSIHRKGSFMYERLLIQLFSTHSLSNEALADIQRQDNEDQARKEA